MPPPSLSPRPKTNPSADCFQYCTSSRMLYWKQYMRRMRSGDETSPLPLPPNPLRKFAQVRGCEIDSETISQRQGDKALHA